jgi:hypothetical protein
MLNFDSAIRDFDRDLPLHLARGIVLDGYRGYMPKGMRSLTCDEALSAMRADPKGRMALDAAQPILTTAPNAGVLAMLTMTIDPDLLQVLYAPLKAAQILGGDGGGERKKGDWTMITAAFPVVERTGDVSSYGDYSANGSTGVNLVFPQRQSYHYQTIMQWGERELAMLALAQVNVADQKKAAGVTALNQFQNKSYFFGVAGLQNYGLLNDPALPAAIQTGPKAFGSAAHGPWITGGVVTATQNEIFTDFQSMYVQAVKQSDGIVELERDFPMVFACDPQTQVALTQPNAPYNSTTAMELIKGTFPNVRFEAAVQYGSAFNSAGNIGQLWFPTAGGQDTGYCAFTEKLRSHPVIPDLSSWKQKQSQGTWGAIVRQPWAVVGIYGL